MNETNALSRAEYDWMVRATALPIHALSRRLRGAALLLTLFGGFVVGAVEAPDRGGGAVQEGGRASTGAPLMETQGQEDVGQETAQRTPWYRSPWAYVVYGIGTAGLVVLLVRWRTAYLERRHQELEEVVAERTREVERQKQQLETYNRELLRTNETLRQTIEEKSQLLGMAAHDLKNPLFGIRALSEIVLETETLPPKSERKLTLIRESADETLRLIDNLLASAASSAQTEGNYENVDLAALAQWVVRSFEPQAERKQQGLSCVRAAEAPCVVEGDKRKLREAVSNLVSNALKYSSPGEDVEVLVDRRDDEVRLSVSDAGPGLSEKDQQRMFAPFQRLSPEPTGGEGSSGLGLYIVKQITEMHNGRIDVETALGEGSTFTLVLPATAPKAAPVPETDPTNLELQE